ncbi:hypothetical protein [Spiroplasma endosymbiont of Labia minor]|uniref:hypothetical protein n=1 Tax=Spiroplasma endosymbiont of Labia minor TaxID=3066305 RepID=UPI0030D03AF5
MNWIIGELKWMPILSEMSAGWKKIVIEHGHTIVAGNDSGGTTGEVKNHNHLFSGYVPSINDANWANTGNQGHATDERFPYFMAGSQFKNLNRTENYGQNENLPTGILAELWQYDPNNEYDKFGIRK